MRISDGSADVCSSDLVREPNDVGNTVLSKYRLQYVEVPLTLRLKTDQNGPFVFYGLFGLEGAVNVKASAERTILDLEDPGMKTDQGKLNEDDEIPTLDRKNVV